MELRAELEELERRGRLLEARHVRGLLEAATSVYCEQAAARLVYPVASNRRALESYLMRKVRGRRELGALVVDAIRTLERCETLLRSMYVPNYEGL